MSLIQRIANSKLETRDLVKCDFTGTLMSVPDVGADLNPSWPPKLKPTAATSWYRDPASSRIMDNGMFKDGGIYTGFLEWTSETDSIMA